MFSLKSRAGIWLGTAALVAALTLGSCQDDSGPADSSSGSLPATEATTAAPATQSEPAPPSDSAPIGARPDGSSHRDSRSR